MTCVVLAIGDLMLRGIVARELSRTGHVVLDLDRPLALLPLLARLEWDAVCLDDSDLGRTVLLTLAGMAWRGRVVGLGFAAPGIDVTLPMPLHVHHVSLALQPPEDQELRLDAGRRVVSRGGAEALLTRTEFRLLEVLMERQPAEVSLPDVLQAVWGFTEGEATSELVRNHVRNLRAKLATIGLAEAVRSRRGRGYAFVAE